MSKHISTSRRETRNATRKAPAGSLPLRKTWPLSLCVGLALGSIIVSGDALAGGPTGGKVVGGVGSISQAGNQTTINQASHRLALNWSTFNVGANESVLFNQPGRSAVALNRILDQNPSKIFGKISSNGQVFLINTHGIIFGASAQLNVGSLMASTLDLTPSDFLAGRYHLNAVGAGAGVVNHGTIQAASGGSVSLVGGSVINDGLILANYGNINLDGAEHATLDFDGDGLINIQITGELKKRLDEKQAAVSNKGTLKADDGTVVLQASAARDLFTNLVNNSGVIDASGISTDGGVVRLVGTGGNVENSGSINVSGLHGGSAQLLSDKNVTVTGSVDASGTNGGGAIRVGGGYQGGEGLQDAVVTYVGPQAALNADATASGDGGSVVLWSKQATGFKGEISARGGAEGGNGGSAEVSSHGYLDFAGNVDLRADHGAWGNLLLDPGNVTISTAADSGNAFDGSGNFNEAAADADSNIKTTTLVSQLGGSNVTVTAFGDITVQDAINYAGVTPSTLTLAAGGDLSFAAGATVASTGAATLSGVLSGATGVNFAATSGFSTNGGNLSVTSSGGAVQLGALSLGTGALTVNGTGITQSAAINQSAGGDSVTFDAGSGAINLGSVNNFTGAVSLKNTGVNNVKLNNGNNALVLGASTVGSGTLTVTGKGITQSGAITQATSAGAATFNGGVGVITLGNAGNDFTGAVSLNNSGANNVTLNNGSNALTLGTSSVGSGTLTVSGTGITQNAATNQSAGAGSVSLNAGTSAVTLNADNDFTGALSATGTGIAITNTNDLQITSLMSSGSGAVILDAGGSLNSGSITTANGNVTLSAAGAVATGSINAGGGNIVLTSNGGALTSTGVLTGNNVSLTSADALVVGSDVNAAGMLALSSNSGGISQQAGTAITTVGVSTISAGSDAITLNNANDFGGAVSLTGGATQINDQNALTLGTLDTGNLTVTSGSALALGNGTVAGGLSATAPTSITFNGALTGLHNVAFSGATPTGTGSVTASTGIWSITGLDSSTFNLTGNAVGTDGGVSFSDFTSADATSISGAVDFDDVSQSSRGMKFAAATNVSGSGTIANVSGDFADDSGVSSASGIAYTGFGFVAGTGTDVTGVTGYFDVSTNLSASSGINYSGFDLDNITGSGAFATITADGLTIALDDTTANSGSSNGISWTSFGYIDGAGTVDFGTGGSVSGNVVAQTLDYSSYGGPVTFDLSHGSGTTTGIGGAWAGSTTIVGSGNIDTLTGNGQTYTLANGTEDAGSNGAVSWTSFENINDATGTVKFGNDGSLSGDLTAQTLDFTSYAQDLALDVATGLSGIPTPPVGGTLSGVSVIKANSARTNTVSGSGASYTLDNGVTNAGSGGSYSWTGFQNITDATGTIHFGTAGRVSGNVTAQTLDYSGYSTAVSFNLAGASSTGIVGTWSGVNMLTGSSHADTVTGSGQTYNLTGTNAGSSNGVSWTSFENLSDSAAGNFVFADGASVNGTLSGGGAGTLDYSAYTTAVNVGLGGTATGAAGWSGIATAKGGSASDTISGSSQTYNLTGVNAGNSGTLSWTSFENLSDSTAGNFVFGNGANVSGTVAGGGDGTLDYSAYTAAVNVGLGGTATGTGGWSGIATAKGGSASDTISGNNQTYTLTGTNAGHGSAVSWTSFENLGDTGTGSLVASNQTWSLTGSNQGTVSNLAGSFSGIGNLTDLGTGSFIMHSGADGAISGNLDAGTGGSLNYTGYTTPVNVNLSGAGTTGVGGSTAGVASITTSSNLGVSGNASGALAIATTGTGTTTTLGTTSVGTNLNIAASGAVLQSGALTVSGTSTINAGANAITLANTGNDFGGMVNLTGGATQITDQNALILGTLSTGALTAISSGALNLGHGSIGGNLSATSNGGAITEATGGVQVSGTSNLQAGTGAITLTDAANHFTGAVTAAGQGVSLKDSGDLNIAALSSGTNGTVNLTAGGALTLPASGIDTGTADLTLIANGGALVMPGALSGANVTLSGRDGITLDSNLTTAGIATLTSSSGAISQTSGALTAGTLTGSSAGSTTLNGANLIDTLGAFSASSFSLINGQALAVNGPLTVPGNLSLTTTAGALSVNGDLGANSLLLDSAADLGLAHDITATTLSLSSGGTINQSGGSLSVSGTTSVNAGANAITLAGATNDFGGAVNLTGGTTQITDKNALTLGTVNTGALTAVSTGALNLGTATVAGNLAATSHNGAISQGGVLTVSGTSAINAGTGAITLSNANNDFVGTTSLTGGTTQITDKNALTLGTLGTGALTAISTGAMNVGQGSVGGNLSATSHNGAISQSGALAISGNSTINAGSGAITLTNGGNDFAGTTNLTGGTTQITDKNALTLGTVNTGALTAVSTGALNLGTATVAGNLAATSHNGVISQGGVLTVSGTSAINAGTGAITLANTGNDFGGVTSLTGGTTQITDKNALTLGTLSTGALTAVSTGTMNVGQGSVGGNLSATSHNGAISQSGALAVNGSSTINAGTGAITLANTGNDFAGTTNLTGGTTQISDKNALTLGTLSTGALTAVSTGAMNVGQGSVSGNLSATSHNGAISQAGALNIAGSSAINAGSGAITLTNTGNDFVGTASLTGGKTQVSDKNALTLGAVNAGALSVTAGGDLALGGSVKGSATTLKSGSKISQGTTGILTVSSLSGQSTDTTTLNLANKIGSLGDFSANNLAITNAQALTVSGTVNGGASTALTTTAGDLAINGSVIGNNTVLKSAGSLTEGANGSITAHMLSGKVAGDTALDGNNLIDILGNFDADFSFTNGQTLTVSDPLIGGPILKLTTTAGDLIINAAISGTSTTLNSAGAITQGAGSVITADTLTGHSAGATTLNGANHIGTLGDFNASSFELTNAQALTVSGAVNGGTSTSLTTLSGDLGINGAVSGTATALTSAGAINEGANGVITAQGLSGSAAGVTSLGSSTQRNNNMVDMLGNFSSQSGFSMTNNKTVTLASLNGSAFTVDAGTSAFYLSVTNGDLLQQGKTWLYNGVGTWGSTGRMGTASAPIYVTGVGAQTIANVGLPPAYFYAVDGTGNLLPLNGGFAVNIPTAEGAGGAQNGNHGDSYIDPGVITANYRSYGIVPSGLRLPQDQQAGCDPDQPDQTDCQDDDSLGMLGMDMGVSPKLYVNP